MVYTLANYLALLKPFYPPIFQNNSYLDSIGIISGQLPVFSYGFFECFFGKETQRIDFNISITGAYNEHLRAYHWLTEEQNEVESTLRNSLEEIIPFFSEWVKEDFQLEPFIKEFWFSFDIPKPDQELTIPWYYISFTPHLLNRFPRFKSEVINRTLIYLQEASPRAPEQIFHEFFNSLSELIQVKSIGIQKNRSLESLRVYLVTTAYDQLFQFLIQYNWPGSVEDLRRQLESFAPNCPLYGLLVDLSPELQPRIGIEIWFSPERPNTKLNVFLDKLCTADLCSDIQADSFLSWEGTYEIQNQPGFWSNPDNLMDPPDMILISRLSRYIKLVYQSNTLMEAKGYFGFNRSAGVR